MSKNFSVSKAALVLGIVFGSLTSFTASAATLEQVQRACTNAFEGKCLHGGTVDLTQFFVIEQVQAYCAPGATFCSDTECTTRLTTILGIGNTIDATGNPCLPKQ